LLGTPILNVIAQFIGQFLFIITMPDKSGNYNFGKNLPPTIVFVGAVSQPRYTEIDLSEYYIIEGSRLNS